MSNLIIKNQRLMNFLIPFEFNNFFLNSSMILVSYVITSPMTALTVVPTIYSNKKTFYQFTKIFISYWGLFKRQVTLYQSFFKSILLNKLTFLKYRFFLKIGLSFRKKYSYDRNEFFLYMGIRHWLRFTINTECFFFNIRKRSIVMFSTTKSSINHVVRLIKQFRKESVFKTKGLFLTRVWIRKRLPRAILFARRVKFFKLKLKLSKKQKTM